MRTRRCRQFLLCFPDKATPGLVVEFMLQRGIIPLDLASHIFTLTRSRQWTSELVSAIENGYSILTLVLHRSWTAQTLLQVLPFDVLPDLHIIHFVHACAEQGSLESEDFRDYLTTISVDCGDAENIAITAPWYMNWTQMQMLLFQSGNPTSIASLTSAATTDPCTTASELHVQDDSTQSIRWEDGAASDASFPLSSTEDSAATADFLLSFPLSCSPAAAASPPPPLPPLWPRCKGCRLDKIEHRRPSCHLLRSPLSSPFPPPPGYRGPHSGTPARSPDF